MDGDHRTIPVRARRFPSKSLSRTLATRCAPPGTRSPSCAIHWCCVPRMTAIVKASSVSRLRGPGRDIASARSARGDSDTAGCLGGFQSVSASGPSVRSHPSMSWLGPRGLFRCTRSTPVQVLRRSMCILSSPCVSRDVRSLSRREPPKIRKTASVRRLAATSKYQLEISSAAPPNVRKTASVRRLAATSKIKTEAELRPGLRNTQPSSPRRCREPCPPRIAIRDRAACAVDTTHPVARSSPTDPLP